ncbi:MAG: hypothetical protein R3304_00810 [Longimicrobiales bacterium]|nr:hypothetical protein [Longimicrobiales bacterium]
MSTLARAERASALLTALRRLEGRATVGDVVTESGLPAEEVRAGLKTLLESHRGHLEVSEAGELVYDFDPALIERGHEPRIARVMRRVNKGLAAAFKAWIVIMLVVYFVVFVVLVVAALVASQRGGDSKGGGWGRGRHRGGLPLDPVFWYWIWGPRWRLGRPYYGHRWERSLGTDDRVPFYKKVFAFVFGPDRPRPTQRQLDRRKLRLIRARSGVLTPAELVQHTGSFFDEAKEEMARLLGAYDGEATVSPDGELVYAFPELMTTVRGERRPTEPPPSWLRLEPPLELTGNSAGANTLIAGMNAFTLVAAASAPWFIFPRLGLGGPAAFFGLVWVPVVFSVLFFAVPLLRMMGVRRENRRRGKRNVRRVLLAHVFRRALRREPVEVDVAHAFVQDKLPDASVPARTVQRLVDTLASQIGAEVEVSDDGRLLYRFRGIETQLVAAERVRRTLRLDERTVDRIVFSTSDDSEAAGERDLALFDEKIASETTDLSRYVPEVDRVDFEHEYELVAFDEALGRGERRRGAGAR